MTVIRQDDMIQSVADALQFISYYHPVDFIQALARAYEKEQSPAARDAIAQAIATHITQIFQATLTQVSFQSDQLTEGITVSVPRDALVKALHDQLIPIFSDAHGLLGEIRLWRSAFSPALSAENEHLLQTIAAQTAVALGRIRLTEVDLHPAWT